MPKFRIRFEKETLEDIDMKRTLAPYLRQKNLVSQYAGYYIQKFVNIFGIFGFWKTLRRTSLVSSSCGYGDYCGQIITPHFVTKEEAVEFIKAYYPNAVVL